MPFQAAPGIAQVVCQQSLRGELILNILHYEHSSGVWTPAALTTLADQIKTNWKTAALGMVASQGQELLVQRFTARDLSTQAGSEVISSVANGAGLDATGCLENSLAVVMTLGTGIAGRSYRGRVYFGGINQNATQGTDPNHLNAANQAGIQQRGAYTVSNGLDAAVQHVVLSRQLNLVMRPEGIGTEVLSYTVNARLDNQRRRMPRV